MTSKLLQSEGLAGVRVPFETKQRENRKQAARELAVCPVRRLPLGEARALSKLTAAPL